MLLYYYTHSLNHNVLQNKNDNVQNQILTTIKEKASLSKQLITCEKQHTEMQIEHTALLHKYDTLVTETEHLSKLFNQKKIEQTKLNNQLKNVIEENSISKNKISENEIIINQLTQKDKENLHSINTIHKQSSILTQKNEQILNELRATSEDLLRTQLQFTTTTQQKEEITEKFNILTTKSEKMIRDNQKLLIDKKELMDKENRTLLLQEDFLGLENETRHLVEEVSDTTQALSSKIKENNHLISELRTVKKMNNELLNEIKEKENVLENKSNKIQQITINNKNLEEKSKYSKHCVDKIVVVHVKLFFSLKK